MEIQNETNCEFIYSLTAPNPLMVAQQALRLNVIVGIWQDSHVLDTQIKATIKTLESFKAVLSCLGLASTGVGMLN